MKTSILNLCGGKILPEIDSKIKPYFLLNLDQIYFDGKVYVSDVRDNHFKFLKEKWDGLESQTYYCNYDVYKFLECYDFGSSKKKLPSLFWRFTIAKLSIAQRLSALELL